MGIIRGATRIDGSALNLNEEEVGCFDIIKNVLKGKMVRFF
jgi:hypothetical protein